MATTVTYPVRSDAIPSDNLPVDVIENVANALFIEAEKVNNVTMMADALSDTTSSYYIQRVNQNALERFISAYRHNKVSDAELVKKRLNDAINYLYLQDNKVYTENNKNIIKNPELNTFLEDQLFLNDTEELPGFIFAESEESVVTLALPEERLSALFFLIANK